MSNNAWETTSLTSLYPLMHFLYHNCFSLTTHNDVGDVVSQALLLVRPEYLGDYIRCVKIFLNTY